MARRPPPISRSRPRSAPATNQTHRPMMIARSCGFMATLMLIVGCGSGSKVAPVSGVITLDGKPLPNAHVAFQPEAGKGSINAGTGSSGVTDASGKYTLRMADSDQVGAVLGTHRVEINFKVESD